MDMLDLKVFIAVAENGSMRKGAEMVALTQPAVSLRIAGLENELSAPLFLRTRSGALLTEAGRKFYFYAQYALSALEVGQQKVRQIAPPSADGHLNIGIVESLSHIMLPAIVQTMKSQDAVSSWKISTGESLDLALRVTSGELDLAFINHEFSPLPHIETVKLFEEPLVFIGPRQPNFPRFRSLSTYLQEVPFILLKRQMPLRELLESHLFESLRMHPRKLIEVDTSSLIRQMVAQGSGCSFLPVSSLWPSHHEVPIERIQLDEVCLKQKFYCAYPLHISKQLQQFLQPLKAQILEQVGNFRRNDTSYPNQI
ncbi:LysR family transcriptional regulator [Paenibacillus vini]|uniref:LysR family transcriptional regulator n=1 Tax=Paenibacillus vini TaxID=1476024 RepID=A0ABQ4M6A3_9BACL|nr:LysR family transcriptional regulator [Paenibacillus vini]MDN4066367.1 LysR family transcriptional regulator [Paenibacillus vini]GIP51526.1 LysR family transcriptional regulator [Paenibacillus vini]